MKLTAIPFLLTLGVAFAQRQSFRTQPKVQQYQQPQVQQYQPQPQPQYQQFQQYQQPQYQQPQQYRAPEAADVYSALKNRPIVVADAAAASNLVAYQTTPTPVHQVVQQYSTPQSARLIASPEYTTVIPILKYQKEQAIDGSYKASYETGNNIIAEETGFLKNVGIKDQEALVQHGSYSYLSPDGAVITVTYTADEGGFRATGDHLPTPPPVPAEIQKALDTIYEQIRIQAEAEARKEKYPKPAADINTNQVTENYNQRF